VAFAEIGDMLDRPVKHYSSGMYSRLAFAVAINVEPDILIVDETLAVGDEMFQARCFARIREMRDRGTTILFVSHARGTILELCTRAVLLDAGALLLDGAPKPVTSAYQRLAFAAPAEAERIRQELIAGDVPHSGTALDEPPADVTASELDNADKCRGHLDPGLLGLDTVEWPSYGARISVPVLRDAGGHEVNVLLHNETYHLEYLVDFNTRAVNVGFGMLVKTLQGHELAGLGTHHPAEAIPQVAAQTRYRVRFTFKNLFAPGVYAINVGCFGSAGDHDRYLHRRIDALAFRVDPSDDLRHISGYIDISAHAYAASAEAEPLITDAH
jgi:lipopolysaccharide transport system ATP-binding protein